MAKEYTLFEMSVPVISVAGVAGGSLAEGVTYHFVVCGCGGVRGAWYNRGMGRIVSPPSADVTFTPDAVNKSVEITLETPANDGISGDAQSYWLFCYTSNDSELSFNGTNTAGDNQSRVIKTVPVSSGAYSYTMAATEFPVTFISLSRRSGPYYVQGIPELQFDGGTYADPITPEDIWDHLDGLGKTQFMDRLAQLTKLGIERAFGYIFYLHLNSLSTGNYFKIPDRQICILAHKQSLQIIKRFYSGNMQDGGLGHTGDYPTGGGVIYMLGRYAHYHVYNNVEVYNGVFLEAPPNVKNGFGSSDLHSGQPQWGGVHYFYDGNYYPLLGRFSGTQLHVSRINADYRMDMALHASSTMADVKIYSTINQHHSMGYPITLRQLQQVGAPVYWVKTYTGYSGAGTTFIKAYDSIIAYEPILANMNRWYGYYNWNAGRIGAAAQTYIGFSFNVNVQDENGNGINEATVILEDKDGNEIINTTTDENGDITEADVNVIFTQITVQNTAPEGPPTGWHHYQWFLDNWPAIIDVADYRPFLLKVTKAGYVSVEMVIDPQQSDWFPIGIRRTIVLKPPLIYVKKLETAVT